MKRDEHYLNICYAASRDLDRVAGARVAALLMYKKFLFWGFNSLKTHPLQSQFGRNHEAVYLHAEVDAIRNAVRQVDPDDLKYYTMYVARAKWNSDKKECMVWGEAKPCTGCQSAILAFRIKRVVYTTDSGTPGFLAGNYST